MPWTLSPLQFISGKYYFFEVYTRILYSFFLNKKIPSLSCVIHFSIHQSLFNASLFINSHYFFRGFNVYLCIYIILGQKEKRRQCSCGMKGFWEP